MTARRRTLRRLLARLAVIVVIGVLLYAGLLQNPAPKLFHGMDKFYHMGGFIILAICTRLAFARGHLAMQVLAMLALGAGIEVVQAYIPGATASPWDFLFDTLGVALGLILMRLPPLRHCAAWVAAA